MLTPSSTMRTATNVPYNVVAELSVVVIVFVNVLTTMAGEGVEVVVSVA